MSNNNIFVADKRDMEFQKRIFCIRFTFKNKKYAKNKQEKEHNVCWKFNEFWWTVLVVSKNKPKTVYALLEPGENIKSK